MRHREAVGHHQEFLSELRLYIGRGDAVADGAFGFAVMGKEERGGRGRRAGSRLGEDPPPFLLVREVIVAIDEIRGETFRIDVARTEKPRPASAFEPRPLAVISEELVAAGTGQADLDLAPHRLEDRP